MLNSHKILIILVIIVIYITNSQSFTNSKSSKKEPFLQPGGSYCWNTINSQLQNECMGGNLYNSTCTTTLTSPNGIIINNDWNTLTPASEINAFLKSNYISDMSFNCNNTCTHPSGAIIAEYNWNTMSTLDADEFNQFLITNNAKNLSNCINLTIAKIESMNIPTAL
jgi:hypothetical protein